MTEKEALERAHRVELLETKTRLEKEHSQNMEQINLAMQQKMQVCLPGGAYYMTY